MDDDDRTNSNGNGTLHIHITNWKLEAQRLVTFTNPGGGHKKNNCYCYCGKKTCIIPLPEIYLVAGLVVAGPQPTTHTF